MDAKQKKKVEQWVKNLPFFFASCGAKEEVEMAQSLVELLKEQEEAYQGSVELLRQKTILFDDAIKRLKKQEELIKKYEGDCK